MKNFNILSSAVPYKYLEINVLKSTLDLIKTCKNANVTLNVSIINSSTYNDWPLKWLVCLIPGVLSMATSIMATLGIFSEPWLHWKGKIVLGLLLHPLHFTFAFVVLVFSMVNLNEIMDKTVCFRLVSAAVTSQWGVIFSTLVLCLGRAMQVGGASVLLPGAAECVMIPAALVLVILLHVMIILISDLSLSVKMYQNVRAGSLCQMFLNSTEMFPRRILGYIIIIVILVVITAVTAIITNVRKQQTIDSIRGSLQLGDVALLQHYLQPPERQPQPLANNNAAAGAHEEVPDGNDGNGNADAELGSEEDHGDSTSQVTVNEVSSGGSRSQDYYDYERRRHRAQSPPPSPPPWPDRLSARQIYLVAGAPRNENDELAPDPDVVPAARPPEQANVPILLLPDIILRVMFPHRNTNNKPRFHFTQANRKRLFDWPSTSQLDGQLDCLRPYPVDMTLIMSGTLFSLNYLPLAVYLIYTSGDTDRPFLDSSFQPFVITMLLKNSVESLFYFVGRQCLP